MVTSEWSEKLAFSTQPSAALKFQKGDRVFFRGEREDTGIKIISEVVNTDNIGAKYRIGNSTYAADKLIKATFSVSSTGSEGREEILYHAWLGELAIQQEQETNLVPPQSTNWRGKFQAPVARCLESGSRVIIEHSGAGTAVDISEQGGYLVRIDNSEDRASVSSKAPKLSEIFMYDKGQQLLVYQDDGSWIDGIVEHFPTTQPIGSRHALKPLLYDTIGEAVEGPLIDVDLNAWNHSPALVSSKVIYEQACEGTARCWPRRI